MRGRRGRDTTGKGEATREGGEWRGGREGGGRGGDRKRRPTPDAGPVSDLPDACAEDGAVHELVLHGRHARLKQRQVARCGRVPKRGGSGGEGEGESGGEGERARVRARVRARARARVRASTMARAGRKYLAGSARIVCSARR